MVRTIYSYELKRHHIAKKSNFQDTITITNVVEALRYKQEGRRFDSR
jgi:hypothetical protein